jgi:hypothetical protein
MIGILSTSAWGTGSHFDFMTFLTTDGMFVYKSQSLRADPDCLPPGCSITSSCAATDGERLFSVAPIAVRPLPFI